MRTRAEIDTELARLEALLPAIVEQYGDEWSEAFAGEAEKIESSVPAEHSAYVSGRISCMLASAGLIPGDNEGEPCG